MRGCVTEPETLRVSELALQTLITLHFKKEEKIPFLGGRLQSGGRRQLRYQGRVMAGLLSASGDWGNLRRHGFALAPRLGGAIRSGSY